MFFRVYKKILAKCKAKTVTTKVCRFSIEVMVVKFVVVIKKNPKLTA